MAERIVRDSDGITVRIDEQEAEQAEITARAKRVLIVDESGEGISPSNPLPVQMDGDFAVNVQENSGDSNIEYVGYAIIGSLTSDAVWKIKRIDCTTGTVVKYAGGSESFTNIFDERESLSYS